MSKRDRYFLTLALAEAQKSLCNEQHGAIVVRNGNILGRGVNVTKNDPRYISDDLALDHCSTHAEIMALRRAGNPSRATVYVARYSRLSGGVNSAPCDRCAVTLAALKTKVVHT